jgi:hypothetical protein
MKELRRRVLLARTPTIATEDALTVARLHDLIIEWATAKAAYRKHPHAGELVRLKEVEHALEDVAGLVE